MQAGLKTPPKDKVVILGDGNAKGLLTVFFEYSFFKVALKYSFLYLLIPQHHSLYSLLWVLAMMMFVSRFVYHSVKFSVFL